MLAPLSRRRAWRRAALLCTLAACSYGGDAPTAPEGPEVVLTRVRVVDLACTDPCGLRLTYEARAAATGEPVAATLKLSGDGWYPERVHTALPDGRVTFYWEFPRPRVSGTAYRLTICPEVGACEPMTATIYLPEGARSRAGGAGLSPP